MQFPDTTHFTLGSTHIHNESDPMIVRWENLLTEEEVKYIEKIALHGTWKRSMVLKRNGEQVESDNRTSRTMTVDMNDPVIKCIKRKLCTVAHKSENSVEVFQLTEYTEGQKYEFHDDFFMSDTKRQRVSTIFVYITDVPEHCGGSTVFRDVKEGGEMLKCRPKRGDGIMWKNLTENGERKGKVTHAGEVMTCSDVKKLGMNVWFLKEDESTAMTRHSAILWGTVFLVLLSLISVGVWILFYVR